MKTKKPKMLKFMIEFERPTLGEAISVACPYCKAPVGEECQSIPWSFGGGKRVSGGAHHDRFAQFLNLEIVGRGSLYRIKP